jgi:hypothetical protein
MIFKKSVMCSLFFVTDIFLEIPGIPFSKVMTEVHVQSFFL